MKKNLQLIITIMFICYGALSANASSRFSSSGCSVAGTASLLTDSICYDDSTMLNLTGYVGNIQWQSYDGTTWINESGAGSTSDAYQVIPGESKQYRALVTNGVCDADTSNIIYITVGLIPVPTGVGATRCGPGIVTLTGTGGGTLQWYADATSNNIIGTGSPFDTYVAGTTTIYLTDNTASGSGASPIMVTEADLDDFNGGDDVEIMNVAPYPVDVTGWQVALSNDYGNINSVNPTVQILSGIMAPGDILSWNDVSAMPLYWGTNMLWTSGANLGGWVAIIDNNNVLRDFVVWDYPAVDIASASLVINGNTYTIGSQWVGNPLNNVIPVGSSVSRQGNFDHSDATDWGASTYSINAPNPGMTLPFLGLGCSSPRVPVPVTVTFSAAVSIDAVPPALCLGQSSTLTITSTNPSYSYSWTPSTGLSDSTGTPVTATPTVPTLYIVEGVDGVCRNRDSVFIDVGPLSVAGAASMQVDTICENDTTSLTLSGSVGHIQWQSNTGAAWVNETASGFDSSIYVVTPSSDVQYRAVVTSGGCNPDTSNTLSLAVLHVVSPSVTDTAGCANDSIALSATGTNVIWFADPDSGGYFAQGNNVTVYVIGDTTFYAASKGGSTDHVGPASNSIGNSNQSADDAYGIGFDVTRPCTLEKVYVYPVGNDTLTVNLRDAYFGPILRSYTVVLAPSLAKVPVLLGWQLAPGVGYRLEIAGGSVPLKYNYSGAITYPYITGNSPLTITGFLNPFLNTSTQYFYFYDFLVFEGCYSPRVPLHVVTSPPQPTIVQNGTTLTSSASTGNQWYWNGALIPGATNQTLIISQVGLYSVYVTVAGCTAIGTINVTFVGMSELKNAGIQIYPNPVNDKINIHFENAMKDIAQVRLIEATGAVVYLRKDLKHIADLEINTSKLNAGSYLLELKTTDGIYRKTIIKQ